MIRTYHIAGKYLGTSPAPNDYVHELLCSPSSHAFFCPTCAEVWARLPVDTQPWSVWVQPCPSHPCDWLTVAGSIWMPWFGDKFINNLPKAVLYRELSLHIAHYERYGKL